MAMYFPPFKYPTINLDVLIRAPDVERFPSLRELFPANTVKRFAVV